VVAVNVSIQKREQVEGGLGELWESRRATQEGLLVIVVSNPPNPEAGKAQQHPKDGRVQNGPRVG
jgi:hypothetical protein